MINQIETCYDIWRDGDSGKFYGDVYTFDRKTRKASEGTLTDIMDSAEAVRQHVLSEYPDAICIHCG